MTVKKTMRLLSILTFCYIFFHAINNIGCVDGAKGLYVFGDSYTDTGETISYPYGMTWPGIKGMGNRSSDGYNEVDYLANLFQVPFPTPWEHLDVNNKNNGGVNFGVGGAGVTFAIGFRTLAAQVNAFEKLVSKCLWSKRHLRHYVALVSIGINDYNSFNFNNVNMSITVERAAALATTVVDGIALSVLRIRMLGVRHVVVASLVPGTCMPYNTYWVNNSTACVRNDMVNSETIQHNALLEDRMRLLNRALPPASSIIIVNMTKAFQELFRNGDKYGFVDPYRQCCMGACGVSNSSLWTVCEDPTKSIIFDTIHPTQAGWKAAVHLYANVPGYTVLGPPLSQWKREHNL